MLPHHWPALYLKSSLYFSGAIGGTNLGMLAEIASCQVEYDYLAHVTGKVEHYARVGGAGQTSF